ncbi:hypothetical protein K7X08_024343 [Anisodus acutangulus]|uniref:Uncharacterized protein n=1 Tax=Anisodus acutangulus TaxID=402998 RepID=A0A9Q1M7M2_9SOLA|nr:hypothetical protein K7X08_024343 [Anisodus acutangulus]
MAATFIRLFLAFLWFSHAINAVPITRSISLGMDISQEHKVLENTHMANMEESLEVEINDYPGSGANNRHTPRPQLGKGCVEC